MRRRTVTIALAVGLTVAAGILVTAASAASHYTTVPHGVRPPVTWERTSDQTLGCSQGPATPPSSQTYDLDRYTADWGVYCEGSPTWIKENVTMPSLDGESLRCSITGGAPYSNVHCYRNLLPEPATAQFTLTLSFYFTPTTTFNNQGGPSVIQALEFTMNKWQQEKRYEWAVQWENVGADAPQWRYWDPHQAGQWVSLGITDSEVSELAGEQWHSLLLEGEILSSQIRYEGFCIDQICYPLDITTPPVDAPGVPDGLAAAVQLDGNYAETPYDLFIDRVHFVREPATRVYLPLIVK